MHFDRSVTHKQLSIVDLSADLLQQPSPSAQLRLKKAGCLYVKSGPPKTSGPSSSRLTYQRQGAAYLRESVQVALSERRVRNSPEVGAAIMRAVRPESQCKASEPNRYDVGHARAMATIVEFADRLQAEGMDISTAMLRVAREWSSPRGLTDAGKAQMLKEAKACIALGSKDDKKHAAASELVLRQATSPISAEHFTSLRSPSATSDRPAPQGSGHVAWHGASAPDTPKVKVVGTPASRLTFSSSRDVVPVSPLSTEGAARRVGQ